MTITLMTISEEFLGFTNIVVKRHPFKKGDKIPVAVAGGNVARKPMPADGCIYVDREGREMIEFFVDEGTAA